jgi:hypothetical protein
MENNKLEREESNGEYKMGAQLERKESNGE